jgi:hypothetical protein
MRIGSSSSEDQGRAAYRQAMSRLARFVGVDQMLLGPFRGIRGIKAADQPHDYGDALSLPRLPNPTLPRSRPGRWVNRDRRQVICGGASNSYARSSRATSGCCTKSNNFFRSGPAMFRAVARFLGGRIRTGECECHKPDVVFPGLPKAAGIRPDETNSPFGRYRILEFAVSHGRDEASSKNARASEVAYRRSNRSG